MEFTSGQCFLVGILVACAYLLGWCVRSVYFVRDRECANDMHNQGGWVRIHSAPDGPVNGEPEEQQDLRIYKGE